jgi:hypothetical protein
MCSTSDIKPCFVVPKAKELHSLYTECMSKIILLFMETLAVKNSIFL